MGKIKSKKINLKALDNLWKPVDIEANLVEADFEGLIGLEEITDYEITKEHENVGEAGNKETKISKKKNKAEHLNKDEEKKQKKQREKATAETEDLSLSETTEGEKSALTNAQRKNKKNKLRKKAKKIAKKSKTKTAKKDEENEIDSTPSNGELNEGEKSAMTNAQRKIEKNKLRKKAKKIAKRSKTKIANKDEENEIDSTPSNGEVNEVSETSEEKSSSGMEAWFGMGISELLIKALEFKGFTAPTQVQALTIPPAIMGRRDILGAAETGSGKTLAFGLPILQGILIQKAKAAQKGEEVSNTADDDDESRSEEELNNLDFTDENSASIDDEMEVHGNTVDEDNKIDEDDVGDMDEDDSENGSDLLDDDSENNGDLVEDDSEESEDDKGSEDEAVDTEQDDDNDKSTMGCVRVVDNALFKMDQKSSKSDKHKRKPLYALIITPTRELAVQVRKHILDAAKFTDIKVALVVGGLSSQKQERLLSYGPEIVVGTPGRLWELIQQRHPHFANIENIRFLAIDETDRMLERGHFEELTQLLTLLNDRKPDDIRRQNFLFSATLSLVHTPPSYIKMLKKNKKKAQLTPESKLQNIVKEMGLENPKVVDITQPNCVPKTLKEARIICSTEDKDFYLYYFLKLHPGRTLVFCNSIGCVQRLHSLFTLLACPPHPLHSNMQQRQRLKNLERFTQNPKAVLVATDVAARGLDVPNVQHVIHYQVPRTAESYVHRSGRTARASEDGLTVLLMDGSEVRTYTKIFNTLSRDPILPDFPIESKYLNKVKERVKLARELDKLELQAKRLSAEESWVKKAVTEMDIELSDDEMPIRSSRGQVDGVKKKAASLRKSLSVLTKEPLFNPAEQLSKKAFITSGITSDGSYVGASGPKASAVDALETAVEQKKAQRRKRKIERSQLKQIPKQQQTAGRQRKKSGESEATSDSVKAELTDGESVEDPEFSNKKKRRRR